jgi:hypothetical protein
MTVHVCECDPGQPCTCGRPKPRQTGAEIGSARSRLARVAAEGGAPSDDDYAFVTGRFANVADERLAGQILTGWINSGHLGGAGFGPDSRRQGAA